MDDLPPGYRFYPTEEELISFYLHKKLNGDREDMQRVIPVLDIYELDPWHLPHHSGELCHGDPEQWFFFCPRHEREARGGRPNRITNSGYWKATGSPGYVYSSDNRVIGVKKTLVFYKGKAPTGRKTKWKMNEYRAIDVEATVSTNSTPKMLSDFSLCRVYIKSGCLRAFDRRPSGVTTSRTTPTYQAQEATPSTSHHTTLIPEKSSSLDSSSSGDDGHPVHTGDAVDWDMTQNLDPLWDWELLDWQ